MWLLCSAGLVINPGLPDLTPRERRKRRVSKCVRAREGAVWVGAKLRVKKVILEEGSFLLLALLLALVWAYLMTVGETVLCHSSNHRVCWHPTSTPYAWGNTAIMSSYHHQSALNKLQGDTVVTQKLHRGVR